MITFVCGELCSGKTFYSNVLVELNKAVYIEVGDLVRSIKQSQDRKVLQDSKKLTAAIVAAISSTIARNPRKNYVICGVRQKAILKAFLHATMIWINCPKEDRRSRYTMRARTGDTMTFEEAEKGDKKLGIDKVKQYILEKK
tara:strand:- start:2058 stop:2483 length:426 start_codon:yes stop_codon:yes gene_type:complete